MALVYRATCTVNGKSYIGFTSGTLARRRSAHERDALVVERSGCTAFHRAIRKYGATSFEWATLHEAERDQALRLEAVEIAVQRTLAPFGYNLLTGGEAPKASAESRRRMSEARLASPKAAAYHLTRRGQARPAETRRKIGDSQRGSTRTEAHKQNIRQGMLGSTALAAYGASMRALSPEQANSVRFLLALGAAQTDVAGWLGTTRKVVSNVKYGRRGYGR